MPKSDNINNSGSSVRGSFLVRWPWKVELQRKPEIPGAERVLAGSIVKDEVNHEDTWPIGAQ